MGHILRSELGLISSFQSQSGAAITSIRLIMESTGTRPQETSFYLPAS